MQQQLGPGLVRRVQILVRRRAETFTRSVRQAHTDAGATAAVREGLALLGELAARPVRLRRERRLDQRLGINTAGDTSPGSRGPGISQAFDDAVAYSPVPIHHFKKLLRHLPIARPAGFAFVDLGCGKGRTLILAAEHGFRPVIGVELDPRLAGLARDTIRAAGTADITVIGGDVVDYEFPAIPAVVFLFNPFGADTLRATVANLEQSLKQAPRQLFVAYFNAVHRDVLDDSPVLRPVARTRHGAVYEAV
ncbi:hypothetical protein DMB66_25665 [Actinoplanes sp. ATCC 53533]|uniref:methyltransferase domain-containing protein n=1 Tax=Actinoplanes sp. ATCC 53533 TaxID=1288362 RepID=UPI000F791B45|nr:class I SAM-dependent methyltransferase [Actinoplanes sp. ATCC 53533]RSM60076.1 hypothetical protein DMB66_25665 [Actinoplanes sp. ATCC 53533]